MFATVEEGNQRILEYRESADAKVRASARDQRVIAPATKHRIRATLRRALSKAVRHPAFHPGHVPDCVPGDGQGNGRGNGGGA
jgi:hypothetical protein